jgi:hypothetical protein
VPCCGVHPPVLRQQVVERGLQVGHHLRRLQQAAWPWLSGGESPLVSRCAPSWLGNVPPPTFPRPSRWSCNGRPRRGWTPRWGSRAPCVRSRATWRAIAVSQKQWKLRRHSGLTDTRHEAVQ